MRSLLVGVVMILLGGPSPVRAQSNDLATYVVFGETRVSVGFRSTIVSGDVGSNGHVSIGERVTVSGAVRTAADVLSVGEFSSVFGPTFFNVLHNAGTLTGTTRSPISVPLLSVRMREVGRPVIIPLRVRCQDANRPTGADGSTGFGVPTLRGIWDTFPLLLSGSAGLGAVGTEPTFSGSCTNGSNGCCTQLRSPINPSGTAVPEEHLAPTTKDAIRAVLTPPLAVPGSGHGAALGLPPSDLDALIAYIRSL